MARFFKIYYDHTFRLGAFVQDFLA